MARKFVLQSDGQYRETSDHVTKIPDKVAAAMSTAGGNYEVAKVVVDRSAGIDTAHIESSVSGRGTSRSVRTPAPGGNISKESYARMGTYASNLSDAPLTDAAQKAARKGAAHSESVDRARGKDKVALRKDRERATTASSPVRPPLAAARRKERGQ